VNVAADAAAIHAARERALARSSHIERANAKKDLGTESILDKDRATARNIIGTVLGLAAGSTAAVAMGMGGKSLAIGAGTLAAGRFVLKRYRVPRALDWIGHKLNSWGDKLMDQKIPVVNWVLKQITSRLDSAFKHWGMDKPLSEHLKKNAEDRKKLAEKLLKEFHALERSHEKKVDDNAKKKLREKKLMELLPPDAAKALLDEMDGIETSGASTAAPAAETPKAA
jgi:hypothetical protein